MAPIKVLFILFTSCVFCHMNYFVFTQLKYHGKWDVYPEINKEILPMLQLVTSIKALSERRIITIDDPQLFFSPFIIIQGKDDFPTLSAEEVKTIRKYIYEGGTIFIDDCSGERESKFDKKIRTEFKKIFPDREFEILPLDEPVFRSYYLLTEVVGRRTIKNYLEGIKINGRTALIYSRNDLFGVWAKDRFGNYLWDLVGGEKQRTLAKRLLINILVFAVTDTYKSDFIHQPFIKEKLKLRKR